MPRYKFCSGVLIKKSMELVKTYFGQDVPESAMCTPTENRGMIFTEDKGKEYRSPKEGLNVWCSHFDGWLVRHIGKARKTSNPICNASGALWEEWLVRSRRWNDGLISVALPKNGIRE